MLDGVDYNSALSSQLTLLILESINSWGGSSYTYIYITSLGYCNSKLIGEGFIEYLFELIIIDGIGLCVHGFWHYLLIDIVVQGRWFESVVSLVDPILIFLAYDDNHLFGIVLQKLEEGVAPELLEPEPLTQYVR